MGKAIRCARKILEQRAFDEFNAGELSPGQEVETDNEILKWSQKMQKPLFTPLAPVVWELIRHR